MLDPSKITILVFAVFILYGLYSMIPKAVTEKNILKAVSGAYYRSPSSEGLSLKSCYKILKREQRWSEEEFTFWVLREAINNSDKWEISHRGHIYPIKKK